MPEVVPTSGEIALPYGLVRWWREGALHRRPLFLAAHGAGAPSASAFMRALSAGLDQRGIAVLRFDFPYMTRGTGRRAAPDPAPVLLAACGAVLQLARSWLAGSAPPASLAVGGKSMGGRMWSMLLASGEAAAVQAALYFGYPLHPPGKPQSLRRDHLAAVPVPQLFVSGSRDTLARLDLLQETVAALPRARLHLVEGGDHSLATYRRAPLDGSEAWLDTAAQFVHETTAAAGR